MLLRLLLLHLRRLLLLPLLRLLPPMLSLLYLLLPDAFAPAAPAAPPLLHQLLPSVIWPISPAALHPPLLRRIMRHRQRMSPPERFGRDGASVRANWWIGKGDWRRAETAVSETIESLLRLYLPRNDFVVPKKTHRLAPRER
jgi:hypothetical protein